MSLVDYTIAVRRRIKHSQRRAAAPAKRSAAAVLYYSRQLNAAGRPFTSRM